MALLRPLCRPTALAGQCRSIERLARRIRRDVRVQAVPVARNQDGESSFKVHEDPTLQESGEHSSEHSSRWRSFTGLEELREALQEELGKADEGRLPGQFELLQRGRVDLVLGIKAFGSYAEVAEKLQWEAPQAAVRRPSGYWLKLDTVRSELELFIEEHELPRDQLPHESSMWAKGRRDLLDGIRKHGSLVEVAEKLQWKHSPRVHKKQRPLGYWQSLDNIRSELEMIIKEGNLPEKQLPKNSFLRKIGRNDVSCAITRQGGVAEVAKKLKWKTAPQ